MKEASDRNCVLYRPIDRYLAWADDSALQSQTFESLNQEDGKFKARLVQCQTSMLVRLLGWSCNTMLCAQDVDLGTGLLCEVMEVLFNSLMVMGI